MSAAHDYAERIRARLPRKLQDAREAAGLSMYALWRKCGVSRDMISRIEAGESIPTFHVGARLAYGVDKTLTEFIATMEDGGPAGRQGDLERGRKKTSEMSD